LGTFSVDDLQTKDYILKAALPRPRDVICLVKLSVSNAVTKGRVKVWPTDLKDARLKYSEFAVQTISTEYPKFGEKLQYEFMGCDSIMTESELQQRIQRACDEGEDTLLIIRTLVSLSFLGVETGSNQFRFAEDPEQYKKLNAFAENYVRGLESKTRRYSMHDAFHAYFEVQPLTA
jgi:hypothetical protein